MRKLLSAGVILTAMSSVALADSSTYGVPGDSTFAVACKHPPAFFNETAYLKNYPDVAASVAAGGFCSGWEHWIRYGAQENRKPN